MPRNIKEKLSLVLDEIQDLSKPDALNMLEKLFNQELDFLEVEREIDRHELLRMRDSAIKNWINFPQQLRQQSIIYKEEDTVRAQCYLDAVIQMLRGKSLIKFTIKVKDE